MQSPAHSRLWHPVQLSCVPTTRDPMSGSHPSLGIKTKNTGAPMAPREVQLTWGEAWASGLFESGPGDWHLWPNLSLSQRRKLSPRERSWGHVKARSQDHWSGIGGICTCKLFVPHYSQAKLCEIKRKGRTPALVPTPGWKCWPALLSEPSLHSQNLLHESDSGKVTE